MDDVKPSAERPPRRFRRLRIAISAFFGLLTVAVCVFWVRSYWWMDSGLLKLSPSEYVQVHTGDGRMCVWFEHKPTKEWFDWWADPITVNTPPDADNRIPWFDLDFWPTFARLYTAHWFLAVVAGSFAVVPWFPRKFSLRGLLIAMTVIAAIVGLIVFVDKNF